MEIAPAATVGILGVAYGPLFRGDSMATNVVVFEETRMVAVVVACGNGSPGVGTHFMQSHSEHMALMLFPLFAGLSSPRYPQGFTPVLHR